MSFYLYKGYLNFLWTSTSAFFLLGYSGWLISIKSSICTKFSNFNDVWFIGLVMKIDFPNVTHDWVIHQTTRSTELFNLHVIIVSCRETLIGVINNLLRNQWMLIFYCLIIIWLILLNKSNFLDGSDSFRVEITFWWHVHEFYIILLLFN